RRPATRRSRRRCGTRRARRWSRTPPRSWCCRSPTGRRPATPACRSTSAGATAADPSPARRPVADWPPMAELTLGSLNLHMGRGASGHDAPFYDVVTACKEIDTDVLALQEAWVPDGQEGDVVAIASALG